MADEKVGNLDGSPWIRNQIQRQSLPLDALRLDFHRLKEIVKKARRELYCDDGEVGRHWVDQTLHSFRHSGYDITWQQLLEWRMGLSRGRRGAADRLLNYISERRKMIKYPEFSGKSRQIGSGPT